MTSRHQNGSASIAESVVEAKLLIRFAARNGVTLNDSDVSTVVNTDTAIATDSVTPSQEAAFWAAFRMIAHMVSPVTVDSIRATIEDTPSSKNLFRSIIGGPSLSTAKWSARKYRCYAVATLLVLIVLQIYWAVGISIIKDTVALEAEISSIGLQMKSSGQKQTHSSESDDDDLDSQFDTRNEWLLDNYKTLNSWNGYWASTVTFEREATITSNAAARNRAELVRASFALLALSNFVLPLLYGFLGACAFVLRDLTTKIRDVTFAPGDRTRQSLRLALGPLAGIAVGLFLAPDGVSTHAGSLALLQFDQVPSITDAARPRVDTIGINSLGPLALAFLAGYSVELLFAVMDRILGAFTERPGGPGAKTASNKET